MASICKDAKTILINLGFMSIWCPLQTDFQEVCAAKFQQHSNVENIGHC